MQKSSLVKFISAGILATSVLVLPMTSPASAQTTPGTGTGTTDTGTTGTTGTTTTTNYENNNDDRGLWGLTGLVGLFGLLGRRSKEENHNTTRRDDTPVYRDPGVR